MSPSNVDTRGFRAIARPDLSALATEQLRELILSGALSPGARLVERDLAATMGISRTPVREALACLRLDSLVVSGEGTGLRVAPLSVAEVREIYPLLATLERFALAHSEPHTSDALEVLERLNERFRTAESGGERLDLDAEWHDHLLGGCRNSLVMGYLRSLKLKARRYETLYMSSAGQLEGSSADHERILEAIRTGHVEKAAEHLEDHWIRSMDPLLAAVLEDRSHP